MIALTWDDVDWERRTLTIRKTMEFRYKQQFFHTVICNMNIPVHGHFQAGMAEELLQGLGLHPAFDGTWANRPSSTPSPTPVRRAPTTPSAPSTPTWAWWRSPTPGCPGSARCTIPVEPGEQALEDLHLAEELLVALGGLLGLLHRSLSLWTSRDW